MTIRAMLQRKAWALVTLAAFAGATLAQTAGVVTPPARAGTAVQGSALKSLNVSGGYLACQAACSETSGCTGYNFFGAPADPNAKVPNPNCSLYAGTLTDIASGGAVSCRMPCQPPRASVLPSRQPTAALRDPGAATATLNTRLPAPPPPTAPPPPAPLPPRTALPATAAPLVMVPPPAPAPAPKSTHKSTLPAATTTPARVAITGFELVTGPWMQIAALSSATAIAQCPGSKIALGAAYQAEPNQGDAAFGIEVRGAMPQGNHARVFVRNANAFVGARVQATAICVNPIAGLRVVDIASGAMNQNAQPSYFGIARCASGERLVGGGAMASIDVNLSTNGPSTTTRGTNDGLAYWRLGAMLASPLAAAQSASARALCAPEHLVDGWEYIETPEASLGARSRTTVPLRCSAQKVMLNAGFEDYGANAENFISPLILITGPEASAQLLNRNTIGGAASLRAKLGAICARAS